MSSHHIIREKQEPALLVLGLDTFPDELFGQLLEWSPTLIVTQNTAEQINAFGIKFDALIGDAVADDLQSDIKHIAIANVSEIEAAFDYLTTNGYPAVNVVTDELHLADYLPYAPKINIVLFYNGQKVYPVTNGFTKWKPAGEVIKVMSDTTGLTFTGLKDLGDSQYQTLADGFFTLQFAAPFLFIAESIT